jgi:hypothetical protein
MTQLSTMQETNRLIMTRIHVILGLSENVSELNLTSHPRKFLVVALDDFTRAANANEALELRQEVVLRFIDTSNQINKVLIKTLLSLFTAIVVLQKAAQQAAEDLQIQNAIDQVKAKVQQLDSNNVDQLAPTIEQEIIACHEALIIQRLKLAPLHESPTSDNPPLKGTSSAPQLHVSAPVATIVMSSQSDSHASRQPAKHDVPRPFPRAKPSGKRTSNVYHFNIPDRKVAVTSPNSDYRHQAIITPLHAQPKTTKAQTDIFLSNDDLAAPLLANEYKLDGGTPKKPMLRVDIPREPRGQIRVEAIQETEVIAATLQTAKVKIALASTLYQILVRALYTHDALTFWSEQVTTGGKKLDKNIHAGVDVTSSGHTLATSMKLLVDTLGNQNIGQMDQLANLVELADTAAEQRFFCCFQPLGRTNSSQALYRTVGNIDLTNLTAESVNDIRTKLEIISPRLVEPNAEAVARVQVNRPA